MKAYVFETNRKIQETPYQTLISVIRESHNFNDFNDLRLSACKSLLGSNKLYLGTPHVRYIEAMLAMPLPLYLLASGFPIVGFRVMEGYRYNFYESG